jgi:RNA-splicing ligase RtcB
MITIKGEFNSADIYANKVEDSALQQIYGFLNNKAFSGSKIVIMPDVHAGAGCVIGFTSTLTNKIIPNLIGVDIGCGVLSSNIGTDPIDFAELDKAIRKNVPSGHNVHTSQSNGDWIAKKVKGGALHTEVKKICDRLDLDFTRVIASLGTLGGGNHFIEVDKDQEGKFWLTLHSGSRNFGLKIANYWQSIAKAKTHGILGTMSGLEYLEGEDYNGYLADMQVAQMYAQMNREFMLRQILRNSGMEDRPWGQSVESVHNYIDLEHDIIRKGAISARLNEPVIIPWNMRDGIIIGVGKGNAEWNNSAPHGAGRVMGRMVAKRTLDLKDFEDSMKGVWTSCVNKDTIDESPMVYKDHTVIQSLISDTVEITNVLVPVYNFKASD